ncbi:hypothetical protein sscle_10g080010 [Sclerotinia sclerotiorum 1980 UF-70]|uniref:Uncharacterized protein n=1 Tax=Sclerotinia sclerotiorum (strain ATCC 18683 / 1980 / Ss-1) TaxID=665079 RepID=A0A1D9QE98_SCLS1|nr:hypothetical protein sscle_10g080010 [Sclerotinia sclerotiorum 1980 UF-70]
MALRAWKPAETVYLRELLGISILTGVSVRTDIFSRHMEAHPRLTPVGEKLATWQVIWRRMRVSWMREVIKMRRMARTRRVMRVTLVGRADGETKKETKCGRRNNMVTKRNEKKRMSRRTRRRSDLKREREGRQLQQTAGK